MTEEKQKSKDSGWVNLNSRFWKVLLVMLAAFLTFVCPTYVVYALVYVLDVDFILSVVSGLILFVVGMVLIQFLIRNKIIT